jgi:hypothetical protein
VTHRIRRLRRTIRALCAVVVMPIVVEMSVAELVTLQRASDDDRRRRLGLPEECDPALVAARSKPGRILVVVKCAEPPDSPPPPDF